MYQAVGTLLALAVLSFLAKDRMLTAAALLLAALVAVDGRTAFELLHKNAFQIGIFFLLVFLLLPIASQKVPLAGMAGQLLTLDGLLAVAAGLGISYIGGKGVGVLAGHPTVLAGVILGTLLAVLLLDGLPAGLIIAAGLVGLMHKAPG
ncbi:MAG: DUF441 family protein [Bacteroidales bacterium]